MMKFILALLFIEKEDCLPWIKSLQKYPDLVCDLIDISRNDWFEKSTTRKYDLFILRPPVTSNLYKQLFDERVEILAIFTRIPTYPTITETKIYENKKYLSYWLLAKGIPAPETRVFFQREDALKWLDNCELPIVAKTNIGASGKGVKIIKDKEEAVKYATRAFNKGIRPYIGPNLKTTSLWDKIVNIYHHKGLLGKRLRSYRATFKEPQRYLILQQYIPHEFEWRVVVIGDSYFAHKKIISGDKASGSLIKDYANPPLKLLNYIHLLCSEHNLSSVSLDLFENEDGYLVNEIQTYFGQSDSFQMKVDGVIGRYQLVDSYWVFEPGDFTGNQCYDLRAEHLLSILRKNV